ncbi:uncharacterized protein A1O9_03751 [Exophiala aquamarina CBS 119918]|uniref:4'-phosphopantetheinyl transferase domain-containing protein n=1 Tax=Exophiala aquamarina CBS 119918 TaxID=1182545 RepID=A0A072PHX4_9EURO|nr:uncharacterized protein A1O9_03751 [Exophiala aquamarina CBS 119918]KEF58908.1 hypothetical protein A1O9_03751 [Exophiala aquamarina CBS 119918]
MRVPFPLSLRVGTDIIATSRILCPINPDQKRLFRLTKRYLHPSELCILDQRFPSWKTLDASNEPQRRQLSGWLAGRWAAKEAAKKTWGASLLSFTDLKVETEIGGGVHIVCDVSHGDFDPSPGNDKVTEQIAQLSISHDGDYTIATVLATPLHDDIMTELAARKAKAEAKVSDMNDLA